MQVVAGKPTPFVVSCKTIVVFVFVAVAVVAEFETALVVEKTTPAREPLKFVAVALRLPTKLAPFSVITLPGVIRKYSVGAVFTGPAQRLIVP